MMREFFTILAILLFPGLVFGGEPAVAAPAAVAPALPEPPARVLALELGDEVFRKGLVFHKVVAPSLVVPEVQFKLYLDQQVIAEYERKRNSELSDKLKECLIRCEGCKAPDPKSSSFHSTSFWVGAVIGTVVGIAVTSVAAYGAYTLARDLSQPK